MLRALAVWAVPTAIIVGVYIAADPFGVVRLREERAEGGFMPNKAVATTNNFRIFQPEKQFDSFIIGPSLSVYYPIADWKRHLPADARPYHFDFSAMTIRQMSEAVDYLAANSKLRNALFITEPYALAFDNEEDTPFRTPPVMTESAWKRLATQYAFFSHWYALSNLNGFISEKLLGYSESKGKNTYPIDPSITHYIPEINEESNPHREAELDRLAREFEAENHDWKSRKAPVEARAMPTFISGTANEDYLRHMASTLKAAQTDYYFVVGANKRNLRLSAADKKIMKDIFGERYIDLTDDMEYILCNPYLFYDDIHYRPVVAREVMDRIYSEPDR